MTVIGVAPASFRGVDLAGMPAVWIPAMMKRQATPEWDGLFSRRTFWMHAIGRLRPGVTADQARARLQPWFKQMLQSDLLGEEFPPVTPEQRRSFLASTIDVTTASRGVSGLQASFERPLRVLMGGAVLLLLLTSLNLAGLLLARGIARTRELATRMALGASRGRVARQLLVESILIAIGGGVLGVAAAPLVSRVLRSFLPAGANVSAGIDGRVLAFTVATTLVAGAVCGVAPIFQLRRLRRQCSDDGAIGRDRPHARPRTQAADLRSDRVRADSARGCRPLRADAGPPQGERPGIRHRQSDDVQPRSSGHRLWRPAGRTGDARGAAAAPATA